MQQNNVTVRYMLDKFHWEGKVTISIIDAQGVVVTSTVPLSYVLVKAWEESLSAAEKPLWMEDVARRGQEAHKVDEAQQAELVAAKAAALAKQTAEMNALTVEMASRKRRRVEAPAEEPAGVAGLAARAAQALNAAAFGFQLGKQAGVL